MRKYTLLFLLINIIFISCIKEEPDQKKTSPVDNSNDFKGYKVNSQAKQLGTEYWENTEVLMDLMVVAYQTPYGSRNRYNTFLIQMTCGDFNNDGWIDIFNPGASYNGIQGSMTFLIWNPDKNIFEEQNLFKDQTIKSFDGNKVKTMPVYLNGDDFVDMVLITAEDEGIFTYSPKTVKLLISDGQGKYEIADINHIDPLISATNGDVGDLNGDKIPDLVLTSGSWFKILWGTSSFPYFKVSSSPIFAFPIVNLIGGSPVNFINDNGFGEQCPSCIENNVNDVSIVDINKDGWNDLILQQTEFRDDPKNTEFNKILLNQGNGKFNESSVIKLPKFENNTNRPVSQEDYIFDDLNGDGKIDIIALNQSEYKTWNIFVYIQNSSGEFEIKKEWIQYTINNPRKGFWKANLIYKDFNNDGLKDITYLDDGDNGETKFKSVFIRKGNQFVEEDIYKFDSYAKSVMLKIKY